jgi:hypothetical protein
MTLSSKGSTKLARGFPLLGRRATSGLFMFGNNPGDGLTVHTEHLRNAAM